MKKLYAILTFLLITFLANAQEASPEPQLPEKKQKEIEALKVAFISKELELTPEEAQRFWPVYEQYSKEMTTSMMGNDNVIDRDEKVLGVRKRYKDQFTKMLGAQRMNRMFGAEGRFRQVLINVMRRQKRMQTGGNQRPFLRKGQ